MADLSKQNVTYTIDKNNYIIEVGDGWEQAAAIGKSGQTLAVNNVIGQPLEKFVTSDDTRMYYDAIYKLCRIKKEILSREYRCDTFDTKRYMRVTLFPLKDDSIKQLHETLREEPLDNLLVVKEKPATDKQYFYHIAKRCSICNRIHLPDSSEWIMPEKLVENKTIELKVIHTICEDCKKINWSILTKKLANK